MHNAEIGQKANFRTETSYKNSTITLMVYRFSIFIVNMQTDMLQLQLLRKFPQSAILFCMNKQIDKEKTAKDTRAKRLRSCGWYLGVLMKWLDEEMSQRLEVLGVTRNQFAILMTLFEDDGLSQIDICQKILLPAYATSRNLDKLESLGLVKREEHESSRRCHRVRLTDAGWELAPALFEATEGSNEIFLSSLTGYQKEELLKILGKLVSSLPSKTET